MFRKLVSNLSFSPALIADIGFYAKRLRNEELTRRTTVLFIVLTLIMQSFAVFSPPESANASSEQDIIHGGVTDLGDFLTRYDHNEEDVKDIYSAAGVSRSEIASAQPGTIHANDNIYVMSRYGQLSAAGNEVSVAYQRSAGGTGIRYFSPLAAVSGSIASYRGWIGHSAIIGWFGIIQTNGSLATRGLPTTVDPSDKAITSATKSVTAINLSQDSRLAATTIAKPLDKISYTLKLTNSRSISVTAPFSVRIADILEYATLIDGGGGTFDEATGTLSWPQIQLGPGQSDERTFAIQLLSSLPVTASGQSNPSSYDCKLSLAFGDELSIPVECPPIKGVEGLFTHLPNIGVGANIAFGITLLVVAAFFYLRTRQLKKEIRIIRHNFNAGII